MGIQVVVKGNKHICPLSDGSKPHIGGTVTEGIDGVTINGIPIATVGSKCECINSGKSNSIAMGCSGIVIDGKPIAMVGSMTEHGGVIIEGIPGVTISGPLVPMSGDPKKLEPKIFNLQWRRGDKMIRSGIFEEKLILSADAVGYEDGEKAKITIYDDNEEPVGEIEGIVQNGRIEVEWAVNNDSKSEE